MNIDETSCRPLLVHQIGWGRRSVKQAQLQGNTKEATTFTVAFSMDRGPLDLLVQGRQTPSYWSSPDRKRTHHVTSENIWAKTTTILQLTATLDNVLTRSIIDGSSEGLAMNKAWRRQSSAEWAARALTDLCDENKVWSTGWRQQRAHSNDDFREAVEEANELHATGALFARQIEPEPAPADPIEWAMAEVSDDEDDTPMPDAPLELELIDMPPAPASAPRMSGLQRCIALRLENGAGPRKRLQKKSTCLTSQSLSLLSHVSVVSCVLARTRVSKS